MSSPIDNKKPLDQPKAASSSASSSPTPLPITEIGQNAFEKLDQAHELSSDTFEDFIVVKTDETPEESIPGTKDHNIKLVSHGETKWEVQDLTSNLAAYTKQATDKVWGYMGYGKDHSPRTMEVFTQTRKLVGESLTPENIAQLTEIFTKSPELKEVFLDFVNAGLELKHRILTQNDPDVYFATDLKMQNETEAFIEKLQTTSMQFEEKNRKREINDQQMYALNQLKKIICNSVLMSNHQIHIDSMRIGLLDLDLQVENVPLTSAGFKEAFLSQVEARRAAHNLTSLEKGTSATFMRTLNNHYLVPIQEWNTKLEKAATDAENKKINAEKGFVARGPETLKQKVAWEDIMYNNQGGLVRATRIVSFVTPNGRKIEARAVLDLNAVHPELTYGESIDLLEDIQRIHLLMDRPEVRLWILECQNSPKSPGELLAAIKTSPSIMKELNALTIRKSDALMRIAVNFTYKMTSGISEALFKI